MAARASRPQARETGSGDVPPGGSWIVCYGHTRDVRDDRVICPRLGSVTMRDCLECRLLVTVARERDERRACSMPE